MTFKEDLVLWGSCSADDMAIDLQLQVIQVT